MVTLILKVGRLTDCVITLQNENIIVCACPYFGYSDRLIVKENKGSNTFNKVCLPISSVIAIKQQ